MKSSYPMFIHIHRVQVVLPAVLDEPKCCVPLLLENGKHQRSVPIVPRIDHSRIRQHAPNHRRQVAATDRIKEGARRDVEGGRDSHGGQ